MACLQGLDTFVLLTYSPDINILTMHRAVLQIAVLPIQGI
jgi:hypothetical protein